MSFLHASVFLLKYPYRDSKAPWFWVIMRLATAFFPFLALLSLTTTDEIPKITIVFSICVIFSYGQIVRNILRAQIWMAKSNKWASYSSSHIFLANSFTGKLFLEYFVLFLLLCLVMVPLSAIKILETVSLVVLTIGVLWLHSLILLPALSFFLLKFPDVRLASRYFGPALMVFWLFVLPRTIESSNVEVSLFSLIPGGYLILICEGFLFNGDGFSQLSLASASFLFSLCIQYLIARILVGVFQRKREGGHVVERTEWIDGERDIDPD